MTATHALRYSSTMLLRNLRHLQRYPGLSLFPILGPVVFLLLFVYVFGARSATHHHQRVRCSYVNFLTPGILLFTVLSSSLYHRDLGGQGHDRGHHLPLQDYAHLSTRVLTGHVLGSLILTLISLAVVISVALLIAITPASAHSGGCRSRAARAARDRAHLAVRRLRPIRQERRDRKQHADILILLPFLSSAFVPVASMPAGLRWFAENQPFTPITNTLRRLLATSTSAASGCASCGAWSSPPSRICVPDTSTTSEMPDK